VTLTSSSSVFAFLDGRLDFESGVFVASGAWPGVAVPVAEGSGGATVVSTGEGKGVGELSPPAGKGEFAGACVGASAGACAGASAGAVVASGAAVSTGSAVTAVSDEPAAVASWAGDTAPRTAANTAAADRAMTKMRRITGTRHRKTAEKGKWGPSGSALTLSGSARRGSRLSARIGFAPWWRPPIRAAEAST
jgi:hypothetical protein